MNIAKVNTLERRKPQYRLGDAILLRHDTCGKQAFEFITKNPHLFEGSLLSDYADSIDVNNHGPQWSVLREATRSHLLKSGIELPDENELVVHLRMGDGKGYKPPAERILKYIEVVLQELDGSIAKVTIVTASHFGRSLLENKLTPSQLENERHRDNRCLSEILELLESRDVKTRIYSHSNIDQDFCFLSGAKYLVLGNGHFSLCAMMVSDAEVFVPPWTRTGSQIDINELILTKKQILGL